MASMPLRRRADFLRGLRRSGDRWAATCARQSTSRRRGAAGEQAVSRVPGLKRDSDLRLRARACPRLVVSPSAHMYTCRALEIILPEGAERCSVHEGVRARSDGRRRFDLRVWRGRSAFCRFLLPRTDGKARQCFLRAPLRSTSKARRGRATMTRGAALSMGSSRKPVPVSKSAALDILSLRSTVRRSTSTASLCPCNVS